MKRVGLVVLWLLLSGCALQRVKVDLPDIQKSQGVVVKDLRPAQEKEGEQFSYIVSSSAYGIGRLQELATDPVGIRVLQHRVFEKFSGSIKGPVTLTINHFVIYANGKGAARRFAIGTGIGGTLGMAIAASRPKITKTDTFYGTTVDPLAYDALAKNEHERAYFTDDESVNDRTGTVYVIYIDAEVNGKRKFTKTISPASNNPDRNALESALQASIDYFVGQVAQ